jgi:hypothetical protein
LTVRAAVIGALLSTLLLLVAAIATFRSRTAAFRLHALYVPIHIVVMIALMIAAHRFSTAILATHAQRDWAVRLGHQSKVANLATVVGALGLLYPLVLSLLYWRYPGEGQKTKMEHGR